MKVKALFGEIGHLQEKTASGTAEKCLSKVAQFLESDSLRVVVLEHNEDTWIQAKPLDTHLYELWVKTKDVYFRTGAKTFSLADTMAKFRDFTAIDIAWAEEHVVEHMRPPLKLDPRVIHNMIRIAEGKRPWWKF